MTTHAQISAKRGKCWRPTSPSACVARRPRSIATASVHWTTGRHGFIHMYYELWKFYQIKSLSTNLCDFVDKKNLTVTCMTITVSYHYFILFFQFSQYTYMYSVYSYLVPFSCIYIYRKKDTYMLKFKEFSIKRIWLFWKYEKNNQQKSITN